MEEWKTYSLAAAILVGTFVLIVMGKMPAESWWQGATVAGGLYGVRTVAKKFSKNGG